MGRGQSNLRVLTEGTMAVCLLGPGKKEKKQVTIQKKKIEVQAF